MSSDESKEDGVRRVATYLGKTCPGVLNGNSQAFAAAIEGSEAKEAIRVFVNDPQIGVLIVSKQLKRPLKATERPGDGELFLLLFLLFL